jgi:hypothetical protein
MKAKKRAKEQAKKQEESAPLGVLEIRPYQEQDEAAFFAMYYLSFKKNIKNIEKQVCICRNHLSPECVYVATINSTVAGFLMHHELYDTGLLVDVVNMVSAEKGAHKLISEYQPNKIYPENITQLTRQLNFRKLKSFEWLNYLFVDESFRKKGVAKGLTQHMISNTDKPIFAYAIEGTGSRNVFEQFQFLPLYTSYAVEPVFGYATLMGRPIL